MHLPYLENTHHGFEHTYSWLLNENALNHEFRVNFHTAFLVAHIVMNFEHHLYRSPSTKYFQFNFNIFTNLFVFVYYSIDSLNGRKEKKKKEELWLVNVVTRIHHLINHMKCMLFYLFFFSWCESLTPKCEMNNTHKKLIKFIFLFQTHMIDMVGIEKKIS